jgi:catechol 2,3-dioxygenase-like lactoylglutathione lyase family enzyme
MAHFAVSRPLADTAVRTRRAVPEPRNVVQLTVHPRAFAFAVVGVAELEPALRLWRDRFGMLVVARREGGDPGLATAWGLAADGIVDQVLLRTPGMTQGGLHLVRFREPGVVVREGAAASDLVPKSVDVAVRDIQARYAELAADGHQFRSPVGRLASDQMVVHQVHLGIHDAVNLVFFEREGIAEQVGPKGYGLIPQIVATSPDNRLERAFYEGVLGLRQTSNDRFDGPAVEKTIGLPPGGALDIRVFGDADCVQGRLEIVQYEGVRSADLYPRARPPARGLLSVTYVVADVGAILARAAAQDAPPMRAAPLDHGVVTTIFGTARMATLASPAGLRIDLLEAR